MFEELVIRSPSGLGYSIRCGESLYTFYSTLCSYLLNTLLEAWIYIACLFKHKNFAVFRDTFAAMPHQGIEEHEPGALRSANDERECDRLAPISFTGQILRQILREATRLAKT